METIPVLLDSPISAPAKAARPRSRVLGSAGGEAIASAARLERIDVDAVKLRNSLAGLSRQLSQLLEDVRQVGNYTLSAVEVAVEITAEGGVALIGSLKAGAKGAITLRFERPERTGKG